MARDKPRIETELTFLSPARQYFVDEHDITSEAGAERRSVHVGENQARTEIAAGEIKGLQGPGDPESLENVGKQGNALGKLFFFWKYRDDSWGSSDNPI